MANLMKQLYVIGAGKSKGFNKTSLLNLLATLANFVSGVKILSILESHAVIEANEANVAKLLESASKVKVAAPNGEEIEIKVSEKLKDEASEEAAPEIVIERTAREYIGRATPTKVLVYLTEKTFKVFDTRGPVSVWAEGAMEQINMLLRKPTVAELVELLLPVQFFIRAQRWQDLEFGETPKATARDRAARDSFDLEPLVDGADADTVYNYVTSVIRTEADAQVQEGGTFECWTPGRCKILWDLLTRSEEAREMGALLVRAAAAAEVLDYQWVNAFNIREGRPAVKVMREKRMEEEKNLHYFNLHLRDVHADRKPGEKAPRGKFNRRQRRQGTRAPGGAVIVDSPANAEALEKAKNELKAKTAEGTATATVEKTDAAPSEPASKKPAKKAPKKSPGKAKAPRKSKTAKAPKKGAEEEKPAAQ